MVYKQEKKKRNKETHAKESHEVIKMHKQNKNKNAT